jgi:hypothetical protein
MPEQDIVNLAIYVKLLCIMCISATRFERHAAASDFG